MFAEVAEQAVLGACLKNPSKIDALVEIVVADDFHRADHRELFKAMVDMRNAGQSVDIVTLGEWQQARGVGFNLNYAITLQTETPSGSNVSSYGNIVREHARRRALVSLLEDLKEMVLNDSESSVEHLVAHSASMIGRFESGFGDGLRSLEDIIKSLVKKWDHRCTQSGEMDGLPTGLTALDHRIKGFKAGDLIVIGARPSMGKTILATQIAAHNAVMHNTRALIFSLEMTAEQLLERSTASIGGVPLDVFRSGDAAAFGGSAAQISVAVKRLSTAPLAIDDSPSLHINQICARARNAHRKSPLGLVVVDHINIAHGDGQSREREVASITGGLKGLAKELGCPVIAVTQLNRGVEQRQDKRPSMSDLRDSGSIEQDADVIMLLYRDEYYDKASTDIGVVEVNTCKFREGEVGVDYCKTQYNMARIADQDAGFEPAGPKRSSLSATYR